MSVVKRDPKLDRPQKKPPRGKWRRDSKTARPLDRLLALRFPRSSPARIRQFSLPLRLPPCPCKRLTSKRQRPNPAGPSNSCEEKHYAANGL